MRTTATLFIRLLFLAIANGYLFNFLNEEYFHYSVGGNEVRSKTQFFIISVIIAPVFETFLLQWLPNFILLKLRVKSLFLLILIPSILFSVVHSYNWLYMVMTFFGGIILNTFYVKSKAHTKYYLPITMLFHSFFNLYGFLFVT